MRLYVMVSPCSWAWGCPVARSLARCTAPPSALCYPSMSSLPPYSVALGTCERSHPMSQLVKVKHRRNQWKAKAKQRSDHNRYPRQQLTRVKAERDQAKQDLKETPTRLRQRASQAQAVAVRPQVAVVWLA